MVTWWAWTPWLHPQVLYQGGADRPVLSMPRKARMTIDRVRSRFHLSGRSSLEKLMITKKWSQPVTISFHQFPSVSIAMVSSDPAQNELRGWAILAQTGEETWQHRCHIERGVLRGHLAGRCGFHHHAVPDQWLGLRYGEHMRGTGFQKKALT